MAVAIKQQGYNNIKLYNGGIKDWKKSGLPTESIEPLPQYAYETISSEELHAIMQTNARCRDAQGKPLATILDLRTENALGESAEELQRIQTACPVITLLLDDLRSEAAHARVPKNGLVVTVSETGNRDEFVARYLSQFGYTNLKGLEFGMRGWLKNKFAIE